ncbi:MAG TPA: hypothetical protein VNY78_02630, partial [Edaphobacter sp.]|nr:hypothetical protein [Edaphobacter sp.]
MTNEKGKDKNNGKDNCKSWLGEVLHSHLRRDEAVQSHDMLYRLLSGHPLHLTVSGPVRCGCRGGLWVFRI